MNGLGGDVVEVTVRGTTQKDFDKALRKFKKLCQDDGFLLEVRERRFFKKPSQKKREAIAKSDRLRKNKKRKK